MGDNAQAQESRDLRSLAAKLRAYARQTGDPRYIALFIATAETLESRAQAIACGPPSPQPPHVDLTC